MIYTSYFGKYKGTEGVSIAQGARWYKGERATELAPSPELLNWYKLTMLNLNIHTDKEYVRFETKNIQRKYEEKYLQQLNKLNPAKIYNKYDGKVLLCFEKSSEFCHRHILAKWLRDAGFDCQEIIY